MKRAAKKIGKARQAKAAKTSSSAADQKTPSWLDHLDWLLRTRRVGEGFALLDRTEAAWRTLKLNERSSASLVLTLAQWVDVGYRDAPFLREMLDRLPAQERLRFAVGDYVRVRMAEAFHGFLNDDAEETIRALDVVLQLDGDVLPNELKALGHHWKARAHRKQADYERASEHIEAALALAAKLAEPEIMTAVLQVQQAWLVFQRGDVPGALRLFDQAEEVLKQTDHWITLGNIASARGRIVRRHGDYAQSLDHFERAVAFYEKRHPHHPNLARAMTNLAFVKRLIALQLRRHIDAAAARRGAPARGKSQIAAGLRPLHRQYQELYRSAISELERAKQICLLHQHHNGLAAALLNAGSLHLDVGDLDLAERDASEAYAIGDATHSAVLKGRAKILSGLIENARLEERLGHPADAPAYARRAKQHCVEAVRLAGTTENKRLQVNAHLALGEVAANGFFNDYDLARRCVDAAAALIEAQEADYVVDELNALKSKLLKTVGIDDTLRGWSQGLVAGKSLREVLEEFSEVLVTKMWLREERKISRVARQLSISPKKVRRLVRHADPAEAEPAMRQVSKG